MAKVVVFSFKSWVRAVVPHIGVLFARAAARPAVDLVSRLAAPPDPRPGAVAQGGLHRHCEPAGARLAAGLGHRDPVRDYDEARAHASSQLADSRIAVLMMPAIE